MVVVTSGQSRPSDREIISLVDEEIPHVCRDYLLGTKQWFIYVQQLSSQVKDVAPTLDASIEKICQRVSLALIWGKTTNNGTRWGKCHYLEILVSSYMSA